MIELKPYEQQMMSLAKGHIKEGGDKTQHCMDLYFNIYGIYIEDQDLPTIWKSLSRCAHELLKKCDVFYDLESIVYDNKYATFYGYEPDTRLPMQKLFQAQLSWLHSLKVKEGDEVIVDFKPVRNIRTICKMIQDALFKLKKDYANNLMQNSNVQEYIEVELNASLFQLVDLITKDAFKIIQKINKIISSRYTKNDDAKLDDLIYELKEIYPDILP